jgi:acylphosphatase
MRVARRFLISGRVQGVGYRFFAERAARREGLHGWVRNLADGRVVAAAEVEAEAMDGFEGQLRHGPSGARVEHIEVEDTVPEGRFAGFSIR